MLNFSIQNIYINHHFMVDKFYFLVFQEDVIEELVRRLSGNIGEKVETNYVANYLLAIQLIQKFKNIKTEIISRAYDQVQVFFDEKSLNHLIIDFIYSPVKTRSLSWIGHNRWKRRSKVVVQVEERQISHNKWTKQFAIRWGTYLVVFSLIEQGVPEKCP